MWYEHVRHWSRVLHNLAANVASFTIQKRQTLRKTVLDQIYPTSLLEQMRAIRSLKEYICIARFIWGYIYAVKKMSLRKSVRRKNIFFLNYTVLFSPVLIHRVSIMKKYLLSAIRFPSASPLKRSPLKMWRAQIPFFFHPLYITRYDTSLVHNSYFSRFNKVLAANSFRASCVVTYAGEKNIITEIITVRALPEARLMNVFARNSRTVNYYYPQSI